MFIVIWKFKIRKSREKDFLGLYGNNGEWVRMFKGGRGYVATELIKDVFESDIYITIDRWQSRDLYEKFLEDSKVKFQAIDKKGENLTQLEEKRKSLPSSMSKFLMHYDHGCTIFLITVVIFCWSFSS